MLMNNMSDFENATKRFPTCSEVFVLFGQVLTEREKFEEATKLYTKAIEIEPKNASILVHKGLLILQSEGNLEKAVELMKSAIKLDEKCAFAYETLGTIEVQR